MDKRLARKAAPVGAPSKRRPVAPEAARPVAAEAARAPAPAPAPPLAPAPARPANPPTRPASFYYSSAVDGDLSGLLGVPHYSYRFAESKFLKAFAEHDKPLVKLTMPEFYSSPESLPEGPFDPATRPVHLIFRSTEEIRLMKLGANVNCFAWEFDVLKDSTLPEEHPFLNQVHMLSMCDEVWVPCEYTRTVLSAHNVNRVEVIPAAIEIPPEPRLSRYEALTAIGHVGVMPLVYNFLRSNDENAQACAERSQSLLDWLAARRGVGEPLVYLAVLNPEDFRKNLDALLRGFYYFQQVEPTACLIVKVLTSIDRFPLERVISDVVPNKLASGSMFDAERIVFMNRYLTDEEMTALYCLADFYVCTSRAEGQNLPLLEAMAHGTVPVSTANTAMADYIDEQCAFVIAEKVVPVMTRHLAGSIAGKPYRVHDSTSRDVFEALRRSAASKPAQRSAMAAAGVQAVKARFSSEVVWPLIEERLKALSAPAGADGQVADARPADARMTGR